MFSEKMESNILKEAFRVLRSNVLFYEDGKDIKTITITSCNACEGRTTVALNLAVSFALSEVRTLLVNADFKKQEEPLLLQRKLDFDEIDAEELVEDTCIKNLSYLSLQSGSLDAETLIDSIYLQQFIQYLKNGFDKVIIDTPPMGSAIDSALIAGNTDASILVIQSGLHDYRKVIKVREQLERAGVRLMGTVLSKAAKREFKSYLEYHKYCINAKTAKTLELERLSIINE